MVWAVIESSVHFNCISTAIFFPPCFITCTHSLSGWRKKYIYMYTYRKAAWVKMAPRLVIGGEGQREKSPVPGRKSNALHTHKLCFTNLQCLWTPATVSMMEHSPSFRQKARSLSSTQGLKTSERRLGSVGATAMERRKRREQRRFYSFLFQFKHWFLFQIERECFIIWFLKLRTDL